jgi:hypothetical protein
VSKTSVSALEREAPLKRLRVVDHRFSLDTCSPIDPASHGIPGSSIAGRGQRHFGPPAKSGMESRVKSLQKPRMASVANCLTFWVGTGWNDQPKRSSQSNERPKGHVRGTPAFDAADFGVRNARGGLECSLAQSGTDSCVSELATQHDQALVREPLSAVVWSLTCSHARGSWRSAICCGSTGSFAGRSPTLGSARGPSVGRRSVPTLSCPSSGALSRRLARPMVQVAQNGTGSRRLAHPMVQSASNAAVSRRLARPTSQAASNAAVSRRLARPRSQEAQLDRRGGRVRRDPPEKAAHPLVGTPGDRFSVADAPDGQERGSRSSAGTPSVHPTRLARAERRVGDD